MQSGLIFSIRHIFRRNAERWHSTPRAIGILPGVLLVTSLNSSLAQVSQSISAQNPAEEPSFVLRQTVQRVLVDVIVTDAQGNPVPGLHSEDFKVVEDGNLQVIRQFEWHGTETGPEQRLKIPTLPPHTFINLPAEPEKGPLTVLLYDVLNTPTDAQPYAHRQMVDFLNRASGQRIAILVLSDRLHLLQGFTSDRDTLLRAANTPAAQTHSGRWQASSSPSSIDAVIADGAEQQRSAASQSGGAAAGPSPFPSPAPADSPVDMQSALKHMEALDASDLVDRRVDATLVAFEEIGRFLAGVSGRKNLIWFSGSFPAGMGPDPSTTFGRDDSVRIYSDRVRAASDRLNAAQVAVYPVDSGGLRANPMFDAGQPGGPSSVSDATAQASKAVADFAAQTAANHATMDSIAERTGGRAIYNTNGLTQALSAAAADGSAYYSLVYAPSNPNFDGSVRHVSVRIEGRNYHLAYRKSYFADDPDSSPRRQEDKKPSGTGDDALANAATFSAPQAHELIFSARVDAVGEPVPATAAQMVTLNRYRETAAKAAHVKFVLPAKPVELRKYVIQYALLASQLEFKTASEGVYLPQISLAALAFNAEGDTLSGISSHIDDVIPESRIHRVFQDGYRPAQVFLVPTEATVIRLVARDERSGRTGSMEVRLPLP